MRLKSVLAVALATTLLAGCGGDEQPTSSAAAPAGAESGAFPATIEHKYGETTIESEPQRVVVAGLREQDALLALGVVPVATTEWYGDQPGAIFPWAKEALGDGKVPAKLDSTDGLQIEKIAAQRPDLIVAIYSGMTQKEYDALSKIAPVVAQPRDEVDYGSSWQEETLISGEAVGKPKEAQELVDDTEKLIADTAAEHPEFEGQQAAMISAYQGIFVYGPDDVRSRLLEELGFQYPPALRDAFPDEFGGQLSQEKTDALDVGTLVWFSDTNTPEQIRKANPVYTRLPVAKEGRDVYIGNDDRVYDATSFVSVLSMPTLMDELVPRLAAAADGDPATKTDEDSVADAGA